MATIKGMSPGLGTITVSAQDDNGITTQGMALGGGQVTVQPTQSLCPTPSGGSMRKHRDVSHPVSVTFEPSGGCLMSWLSFLGVCELNLLVDAALNYSDQLRHHFSGLVGDVSVTAKANGVSSVPFAMTAKTPLATCISRCTSPVCYSSPETYTSTVKCHSHDNLNGLMSSSVDWNEVLGARSVRERKRSLGELRRRAKCRLHRSRPGMSCASAVNPNPARFTMCILQPTGIQRDIGQFRKTFLSAAARATEPVCMSKSDTLGYYVDHGQHDSIQIPSENHLVVVRSSWR